MTSCNASISDAITRRRAVRAERIIAVRLLLTLLAALAAHARPANPQRIYTYAQPDGARFTVRLSGDERLMFHETTDGYTVLQDARNGVWYYATADSGVLEAAWTRAEALP